MALLSATTHQFSTFLGCLQGVQNVLTMGFFECLHPTIHVVLGGWLSWPKAPRTLNIPKCTVFAHLHSEGLFKASSRGNHQLTRSGSRSCLKALQASRSDQTINGQTCMRAYLRHEWAARLALREGPWNRFAVSGADSSSSGQLLALGVWPPGHKGCHPPA